MVAKIMRSQLGKRNADALTWRLGPCGGARIGSLLPVGVPREEYLESLKVKGRHCLITLSLLRIRQPNA